MWHVWERRHILYIQGCGGENLRERGNLENLSVDGIIILKWL